MTPTITFRAHHFLCALCFRGKGYSPDFIVNFTNIMEKLQGADGDDTMLTVVADTDAICSPCPHRREQRCTSQEKIVRLDHAHMTVLGIKPGDTLTWGRAKQLIAEQMTLQKFHQACAPCQWKKLGICEEVLNNVVRPLSK